MKITLNWLKKHGACSASMEMFAAQPERDAAAIVKLLREQNTDWANWLICRMLTRKQKIQFAVFAAEQVLPIFEVKYPDDSRPRLAIEAAKNVIDRNTIKNRSAAASCAADAAAARATAYAYAAADVASAAAAAAAAADAAASTAYAAARATAYVDVDADVAFTAASAAYAAAYAAALASSRARAAVDSDALVRAKMQATIITYGLSLLEGKK